MPDQHPRICVVIPVYNNGATVRSIAEAAAAHVDGVIVVNDGSTDATQEALSQIQNPAVKILNHPANRGKGAALRTGFDHALALGYTHAVTIDADGQHAPDDVSACIGAIAASPDALIIGLRDLSGHGRPLKSRILRAHSNFWVWAETGKWVADTQSGFRGYPLAPYGELVFKTNKYDFEIESLVKLMWRGVPVETTPVVARYGPGSESHFRPFRDFLLVTRLNASLFFQRLLMPVPMLASIHLKSHRQPSMPGRIMAWLREWVVDGGLRPATLAVSVAIGVLMAILPIWGLQTVATLFIAHLLNANKAVAIAASNISFPATVPLIILGSVATGHFVFTGSFDLPPAIGDGVAVSLWECGREYVIGAVVFGIVAAAAASALTYAMAVCGHRFRKRASS